jgi:3-oxoacyl-[acyl-carrier-protein] synthase II
MDTEKDKMRKRVVVTGLGCVTPLGNDADKTWKNILEGRSGAGPVTRFDASEHKSKIAAEVKDFDPEAEFGRKEARRMDRFAHLAMTSTLEALEDSGLRINDDNRDRIGVMIGTGVGGAVITQEQLDVLESSGPNRLSPFLIPMMMPNSAGGMIAIHLGVRGPNMTIVTACATGTNSIGESTEMIRRGRADVIFAGAADSIILPVMMAGFDSMNALTTRNHDPEGASRPFDKDRDGFLMSEGAAVLTLESLDHAQARRANILGEILGYGATNDAYHIAAPAENGAGAVRCMQIALDNAGLGVNQINYINAHGTSTQLNDLNETQAIKTVFGEQAYSIPVSSTKSMTGHMMGASGALEALFCIKALQENVIPPTINYETPDPECDLDYVPNEKRAATLDRAMSNSFGFGGHNATLIFGKYQEASS